MNTVRSRGYEAIAIADLGPTSASSADYFVARQYLNPRLSKVQGFGMEFGQANTGSPSGCTFYPTKDLFHSTVRETAIGFMEFLLTAAKKR